MEGKDTSRIKREIRNILLILASGMLFAGAITCYMINRYGPMEGYHLSSALINPAVAAKMDYYDPLSDSSKPLHYTLSGFEFSYLNKKKEIVRTRLQLPNYENFYRVIANNSSLQEVTKEVMSSFNVPFIPTLSILVKPDNQVSPLEKIFQSVQFAPNNSYYRIQLHDDRKEWVYFFSPEIYSIAQRLFTEEN